MNQQQLPLSTTLLSQQTDKLSLSPLTDACEFSSLLLQLPDEVICSIILCVDFSDLITLQLTCRKIDAFFKCPILHRQYVSRHICSRFTLSSATPPSNSIESKNDSMLRSLGRWSGVIDPLKKRINKTTTQPYGGSQDLYCITLHDQLKLCRDLLVVYFLQTYYERVSINVDIITTAQ